MKFLGGVLSGCPAQGFEFPPWQSEPGTIEQPQIASLRIKKASLPFGMKGVFP